MLRSRSWLSAAKPTQNGRCAAPSARDRGEDVGVLGQLEARHRLAAVLLDLLVGERRPGASRRPPRSRRRRRGAAPAASPRRASRCAVPTSMRRTPRGVGRCTGPATSVTSAPASAAARAIAKPILPLERLVMPRTGSIGSKVGPAVISTALARQQLRLEERDQLGEQLARPRACGRRRSRRRPGRRWPGRAPSRRRRAAARRCAASPDAPTSRGSSPARRSSGQRSIGRARHSRLSRSSARPCTSLAMKSALAGATSTASASRVRLMCAMLFGSRASHWLVYDRRGSTAPASSPR